LCDKTRAKVKKENCAMANLTPGRLFDPLQDIRREFDQLFERFLGEGYAPLPGSGQARGHAAGQQLIPQVDMKMDEGQLTIDVDLPGVPPADVDITLQDGVLTVRGHREDQRVESRGGVQIKERHFGEFERRMRLPEGIDEESVHASFENGVLSIAARMKPGIGQQRRIEVGGAQQGQTRGKVSQAGTAEGRAAQVKPSEGQKSPERGGSETQQTPKSQAQAKS
jgi:HSP20 family protein